MKPALSFIQYGFLDCHGKFICQQWWDGIAYLCELSGICPCENIAVRKGLQTRTFYFAAPHNMQHSLSAVLSFYTSAAPPVHSKNCTTFSYCQTFACSSLPRCLTLCTAHRTAAAQKPITNPPTCAALSIFSPVNPLYNE